MSGSNEVKTGDWIKEGFDIFKDNLGEIWLFYIVGIVILAVASAVTAGVGAFILSGPIVCSLFYGLFKKMRGGEVEIGEISAGFQVFVPAMLASIVIGFFTAIGTCLCIIPGIIVAVLYMFTFPLIIEKKMDFWLAMETSRKKVMENLVGFVIFGVVTGLISIAGALLCGIGSLITVPIALCAIGVAYRDVFGLEGLPQVNAGNESASSSEQP
jgi:uncharacterized membrane protein